MRKDKEQQKKPLVEQLRLFSATGEPVRANIGGTDTLLLTGVELSSRLEKQRTLTENVLVRIVDYGNLKRAYKQLAANGGSSGVDEMDIEELRHWLGENLNNLRDLLLSEKYEVSPVRKVEIEKPDGGIRTLGIPTVKDRFVQQAIHQELSRYYEPYFSEHSYGFRPNRDAGQAILQATTYIGEGKEWVVDIDLEKFFDRINHDRLMQRLSKGIGDKRLLRLINAFLKQA
jgi:RNA-directed DNA polymerase